MKLPAPEIMSPQRTASEKALGLRDLRYFLSVAQTGNVGRSAHALRISAPAISMRLRKLEDRLGVQLLIRHGRGMALTSAGACLRDRASTVVQLLALPLTSPTPDQMPEAISFGVTAEVGRVIVPFLATAFQLRWPNAHLAIREGRGCTLEEWLIHRHVDVAILDDPPALEELELIPVLRDRLGLVAPVYSDLGQDIRPLPVRELGRYPLILPQEQHWLRRRLDQVAHQRGIQLSPVLQVDSVPMITSLVRGELGFSILPRSVVEMEVARGELTFRPIVQPSLPCNSSVGFHRAAPGTQVATFANMTRLAVTTFAREGAWPGVELIPNC
jgi:LysR family transcriptional regulator, nitrogen assimilation regulatory protein